MTAPPLPNAGGPGKGVRRWQQFLRFLVVGAIATTVQYCVLIAGVELLGWQPVWASGLGFALGAVVNYVLNRNFTFQSNAAHGRAVLRFAVVALTGLGWNSILMHVLNERLGYPYLLAQVLTTGMVLVWNFCGNALWSFAPTRRDPDRGQP
ncbi:MAG: GtrA family protein [Pseudomonadota bacterium]